MEERGTEEEGKGEGNWRERGSGEEDISFFDREALLVRSGGESKGLSRQRGISEEIGGGVNPERQETKCI